LSHTPSRTELYTLSLHDALPIYHLVVGEHLQEGILEDLVPAAAVALGAHVVASAGLGLGYAAAPPAGHRLGDQRFRFDAQGLIGDRKSTRLNSSHSQISYAVFCL